MKKQVSLSVCLIVKDEEKNLPDCLRSVQELADEIIVIDTGSKDRSKDIAKRAGAKVISRRWRDDFSDPRNCALDHASGKWILFLDADETISREQHARIRELMEYPLVEGYLLTIRTKWNDQTPVTSTQALRLFRNRKEYRYINRVFERIPEEKLTNIKEEPVIILHLPDSSRKKAAYELKMRLLALELEQYPDDPYLRYVYGIELLNANTVERSIPHFQQALKHASSYHIFRTHLYKCLGWAYYTLENHEEALHILDKGLGELPHYTDLYYLQGQCRMRMKQYGKAIEALETGIKIGEAPASLVSDAGVGSYRAYFLLGQIHEDLANGRSALDCYRKAYQLHPSYEDCLYAIGSLLRNQPELGEVDQELLSLINPQDLDQRMTVIDVLCIERQYQLALSQLDDVEKMGALKEDLYFVKGICYMMLGQGELAEETYVRIEEAHPYYEHVLLRRIQNYWFQAKYREAEPFVQRLLRSSVHSEPVRTLYRCIQRHFNGENAVPEPLDPTAMDTLSKIIDHLLWLKKPALAAPLIEWLLQSGMEQLWIQPAERLLELGDYEGVEAIYARMNHTRLMVEFKEKMCRRIMALGPDAAVERILNMGSKEDMGPWGYLVWDRLWRIKTEKILQLGKRSRRVDRSTKQKLSQWLEMIHHEC